MTALEALVQITPRLAPSIGGIADYARLLAGRLRQDCAIDSRFLVGDPAWQGPVQIDGFTVERLVDTQAQELQRRLAQLDAEIVLIHYVGYGYQNRGCPVWLWRGLQSWKSKTPGARLLVMFHELFAYGRPWQSSFWTSPLQRALTRSLAQLSDHCLTNLSRSARWLAAVTGRPPSDFTVLPVFSNVGELSSLTPPNRRAAKLVVLGSAAWRRQVYFDHGADLAQACRALEIEQILDIGPSFGALPKLPVAHSPCGTLPLDEIHRQLTSARAGFFTCPAPYLGKSSIFAAYAAHGLVPLTYAENRALNHDGLTAGEHFLPIANSTRGQAESFTSIMERAHGWYHNHSLAKQAQRYFQIFLSVAQERVEPTESAA
jgi:hypothetical protein